MSLSIHTASFLCYMLISLIVFFFKKMCSNCLFSFNHVYNGGRVEFPVYVLLYFILFIVNLLEYNGMSIVYLYTPLLIYLSC